VHVSETRMLSLFENLFGTSEMRGFLKFLKEFQASGHITANATPTCSPPIPWRIWQELFKREPKPKLSNTSWIFTQLNQDTVG